MSVSVKVYYTDGREEEKNLNRDNLLSELQALVKGYIERVVLNPSHIAIVNEEGLLHRLQRNAAYPQFVGNVVIMASEDFD